MTEFQKATFSVKTGARDPKACDHSWLRPFKGKLQCVTCGHEETAEEVAARLAAP